MLQKISSGISYPDWAKSCRRWKTLDIYDRLLAGTFYDHLQHAFYDEVEGRGDSDRLIPIDERRPSAQYKLPRRIAQVMARKLFAGRHAPKIRHENDDARKKIENLCRSVKMYQNMLETALIGSVGSAFVSFRLDEDGTPALSRWHARDCWPAFADSGELQSVRLAYVISGSKWIQLGASVEDADEQYWFVRDWTADGETTYMPIQKDDWNPVDGFSDDRDSFVEWQRFDHGFGFVPGHWFVNLPGGTNPDGACTWGDAIPNSIEIDYLLSQTSRGVRYNCAPELVIKGDISNMSSDGLVRGPTSVLMLEPDKKDGDGNVLGGADAKLLEMTGKGTETALKFVDYLRNMALEQCGLSRKDPEKIKGPMSGRAMEFMEEDTADVVSELRSQYGEFGMLPLLRKLCAVVLPDVDTTSLNLQWPRLYQPTPQDIAQLVPAFAQALNPLGVTVQEKADGSGATMPPEDYQLLTPEEARGYLKLNLDMSMIDIDNDDDMQVVENASGRPKDSTESNSANNAPIPDDEIESDSGNVRIDV